MVGPMDPASFNFLGITPTGAPAAPPDPPLADKAPTSAPQVGTDRVEISQDALDAARAVTPASSPQASEDALPIEARPSPPRNTRNTAVSFRVDAQSGRRQAQVADRGSGEVRRKIPTDEQVAIARQLSQTRDALSSARLPETPEPVEASEGAETGPGE